MALQRWTAVRRLCVMVGGGLALLAVLLAVTARGAAPVKAAPPQVPASAWASGEPVTTTVSAGPGQSQLWSIPQYGITITFRPNSVNGQSVFTFTPQPSLPGDFPRTLTPYYFALTGIWTGIGNGGRPVSLGGTGIEIELDYVESDLGTADESSLGVMHYRFAEWADIPAALYLSQDAVVWETMYTGYFALGGYGERLFVPVVYR